MAVQIAKPSPKAHRLIWFLHAQMLAENMTQIELANRSGIKRTTLRRWWTAQWAPNLLSLEAALNSLGYTLKPTPLPDSVKVHKISGRRTNAKGMTEN